MSAVNNASALHSQREPRSETPVADECEIYKEKDCREKPTRQRNRNPAIDLNTLNSMLSNIASLPMSESISQNDKTADQNHDFHMQEVKTLPEISKNIPKPQNETQLNFLIVGLPNAGRQTLMKQLGIFYNESIDRKERLKQRYLIYGMLLSIFKSICGQLCHNSSFATVLLMTELDFNPWEPLPEPISDAMFSLLENSAVREIVAKSAGGTFLEDSAIYFLENLDRILDLDYCPTIQGWFHLISDILHTTKFESVEVDYLFYKQNYALHFHFLHDFENIYHDMNEDCFVHSLIFCVSAASYCELHTINSDIQSIEFEEEKINKLAYALEQVSELLDDAETASKNIVIILTKIDLLEKRIENNNITEHFPQYEG